MRVKKINFLSIPLLSFLAIAIVGSVCLCVSDSQAQAAMDNISNEEQIISYSRERSHNSIIESCHGFENNCCINHCYNDLGLEIIKNGNNPSPSFSSIIISPTSFLITPFLMDFEIAQPTALVQVVTVRSVVQRE